MRAGLEQGDNAAQNEKDPTQQEAEKHARDRVLYTLQTADASGQIAENTKNQTGGKKPGMRRVGIRGNK